MKKPKVVLGIGAACCGKKDCELCAAEKPKKDADE